MGWLDDYSQIKSFVVCPGVGATGFNALGSILKGDINPSAKTTDTWVYDITETPYFNNIGHFAYDNVEDITSAALAHWERADGIVFFVNYVEGIYVGYRFFETAAAEGLGSEDRDLGVDGWYAPSMNMHRSAFAGRNFEYYSEDPVLSGEMAKAECQGVYEYDLYPFIKHFALNDQEINRNAICCTWSNEQAIREIYLKPFEDCIKDAGDNPISVMSSYNYIGAVWAAASPELQNTVLREEWGHQGMVISDYFGNYGYMDADKAIRGGTDMMLATAGNDAILTDTTSATSILAMRQASKNIMYTMVNSYTYDNYNPDEIPGWVMKFYIADAVLAAVVIALEVVMIRNYKKKEQSAS